MFQIVHTGQEEFDKMSQSITVQQTTNKIVILYIQQYTVEESKNGYMNGIKFAQSHMHMGYMHV